MIQVAADVEGILIRADREQMSTLRTLLGVALENEGSRVDTVVLGMDGVIPFVVEVVPS